MNIQSQPRMSVDAFFRWAEDRQGRYELVNGIARLQPWVKRNHNRITVNIVAALDRQIDKRAFEIATGDFAVSTGPNSLRYADVMVEPAGASGQERTTSEALLLVEVLSESTMHVDFGEKLLEYQALSSLDTYLVVAQDFQRCWQWTRGEVGEWPQEPLHVEAADAIVVIDRLKIRLAFEDIYRNVS